MFRNDQIEALQAPLKRENVKSRKQSGLSLSYIEGWKAIEEANRIFGFDAWASETIETRMVAENQRKIGAAFDQQGNPQKQKDGWSVSYIAKVRVTVGEVIREGVGAGHGIDVDLGLAHESAIKEGETDARKRALMTFGNPFGLALYDKKQENVEDATPPKQPPPPHITDSRDPPRQRDTRPSPAHQSKTGSISERASTSRTAGKPTSTTGDANPFDATDDERGAYIVNFQSNVENCESLGELDAYWISEAHKRSDLGIGKGSSGYSQLTRIAADRKSAIEAEVGKLLMAG